MKFRVRVQGKDSISECCCKPAFAAAKAAFGKRPDSSDEWDATMEASTDRIRKFAGQVLIDEAGGDDGVVVELDTEAGTCVVVPRVRKIKPY